MTPKQQRFVDEYLIDLNATQAYIRAGYAPNDADVNSSRLMGNDGVAAAIALGQAEAALRAGISVDRVVDALAAIAFAHVRDAVTWSEEHMAPIASVDLDEHTSAAIKEVRIVRTRTSGKDGYEQERVEQRITLHDKGAALERLGKHLGMWPNKISVYDYREQAQRAADALGIDVEEVLIEAKRLTEGK